MYSPRPPAKATSQGATSASRSGSQGRCKELVTPSFPVPGVPLLTNRPDPSEGRRIVTYSHRCDDDNYQLPPCVWIPLPLDPPRPFPWLRLSLFKIRKLLLSSDGVPGDGFPGHCELDLSSDEFVPRGGDRIPEEVLNAPATYPGTPGTLVIRSSLIPQWPITLDRRSINSKGQYHSRTPPPLTVGDVLKHIYDEMQTMILPSEQGGSLRGATKRLTAAKKPEKHCRLVSESTRRDIPEKKMRRVDCLKGNVMFAGLRVSKEGYKGFEFLELLFKKGPEEKSTAMTLSRRTVRERPSSSSRPLGSNSAGYPR